MPSRTVCFKNILLVLFLWTFTNCKNADETPLSAEWNDYSAPVTVPLKFGPSEKIAWPETKSLTSVPGKFDFEKLPSLRFDSAGFNPLPKPPEESIIDLNKLPKADFNYDSLPGIPLKFKTAVIPLPEIAKVGRPVLKNSNAGMIYDLGDQLGGVAIQSLLKTKDGFTWIVTAKGIYRYDGESLYLYIIKEIGSGVLDMAEDKDGQIWMVTRDRGIVALDFKNGVSRQVSSTEGLISNFGIRVIIDHDNRVWATFLPSTFDFAKKITGGSVAIIDQEKKNIKLLQKAGGLSAESPTGLVEDGSHNIWIATIQGGLNILNLKDNQVRYLDEAHGLATDTLTELAKDRWNRIWIGSFKGNVHVADVEKGSIKKFGEAQGFPRRFIGGFLEDFAGNMWIGTDDGIIIINSRLGECKTLGVSGGLNGKNNALLMEDALHQVWMGSDQGLNMIYKKGEVIRRVGNVAISTQMEDTRGRIWIGTLDRGIQILDTATGLAKLYTRQQGLSDDLIQYIVEHNGKIILSTQKGGIEIIDTSLKKIERIGVKQGLVTANVTSIERDKQNNIWLGGIDVPGIDILDLQNKNIRHIGSTEGLNDSTILDIKKDRQGIMWFYSQKKGIGQIDIDSKTVKHIIQSDYKSLTGAAEDNQLLQGQDGKVWLFSSVNGLFAINAARDSVTHFTTAQGLLSNRLTSLKEYKGRIYAGSGEGLNILTPPSLTADNTWQIESLGRSDGIAKNARTFNSDLLLANGQYWWGDEGITIISNLNVRKNDSIIPATYITGFDVYNRRQNFVTDPWKNANGTDTLWNRYLKKDTFYVNGKPTSQTSELNREGMQWDSLYTVYNLPGNLQLPYNKNYLQFHFSQAHFGTQDTVWYRYILEGVDQEWSEKTFRGFSENYPGISPGHYTFKVASLYRGKWCEPVAFSFTIAPPWWKTWWAYVLYGLAGIALLRAYIVYRSRRLKRENKLLEEKINLRTNQLQQSLEDLKATQSQLIQSEKMASLGELTAGIAHEIQNPLNFINNFSEVNTELIAEMKEEIANGNLEEVKSIADDIAANEQKINHHGKRADGIVKGMLQHSRSGNRQKEPTNINTLADEYLRLAYHGLRAKDKSFNAIMKTDFDDSIGEINIIPQDVGRVILNLITNAFYAVTEKKKYLVDGYEPTVSVSTKKGNGKVEVVVKDNGNGIPQKVREKIFQPFFTTKPTGEGTGLGLSLSYDIIKAHNGELKVETKEGEGATFSIILPQ